MPPLIAQTRQNKYQTKSSRHTSYYRLIIYYFVDLAEVGVNWASYQLQSVTVEILWFRLLVSKNFTILCYKSVSQQLVYVLSLYSLIETLMAAKIEINGLRCSLRTFVL